MSGENSKRSIDQKIDHVRECIERCMQMYMNKRETVNFLATQGNIQPAITRIVWARLERDNPEFFRAYYVRLAVQDQIMEFNRLLPVQAELMRQTGLLAWNANVFNSNASHTRQQISTPNFVQGSRHPKTENMQHVYALNTNGPSIQACMQGNLERSYVPPNMFLSQNPNVVLAQTANEQFVCGGRSDLNFEGHSNFMESNHPTGDAYMSHFSDNNAQHLDDFLLNYEFLEQYQQTCVPEFPMDSSSSSGLSLSSNAQHLDDFLLKYGVWEQYQPNSTPEYQMDSSSSTGNVELMDPGSSGSLRNPFFG